jgi:hypothetical protein
MQPSISAARPGTCQARCVRTAPAQYLIIRPMDTQRAVYYLPGHGGRLHTG